MGVIFLVDAGAYSRLTAIVSEMLKMKIILAAMLAVALLINISIAMNVACTGELGASAYLVVFMMIPMTCSPALDRDPSDTSDGSMVWDLTHEEARFFVRFLDCLATGGGCILEYAKYSGPRILKIMRKLKFIEPSLHREVSTLLSLINLEESILRRRYSESTLYQIANTLAILIFSFGIIGLVWCLVIGVGSSLEGGILITIFVILLFVDFVYSPTYIGEYIYVRGLERVLDLELAGQYEFREFSEKVLKHFIYVIARNTHTPIKISLRRWYEFSRERSVSTDNSIVIEPGMPVEFEPIDVDTYISRLKGKKKC